MPARQENRCLHLEVQTGTCPGDGRDPDKRPKEPFRAHNRSLVQGPLQSSILSLAGLWQAQMGERERPLLAVAPRSAASSSPSLACSCQGLGNGEGATTRPARPAPLSPHLLVSSASASATSRNRCDRCDRCDCYPPGRRPCRWSRRERVQEVQETQHRPRMMSSWCLGVLADACGSHFLSAPAEGRPRPCEAPLEELLPKMLAALHMLHTVAGNTNALITFFCL